MLLNKAITTLHVSSPSIPFSYPEFYFFLIFSVEGKDLCTKKGDEWVGKTNKQTKSRSVPPYIDAYGMQKKGEDGELLGMDINRSVILSDFMKNRKHLY